MPVARKARRPHKRLHVAPSNNPMQPWRWYVIMGTREVAQNETVVSRSALITRLGKLWNLDALEVAHLKNEGWVDLPWPGEE